MDGLKGQSSFWGNCVTVKICLPIPLETNMFSRVQMFVYILQVRFSLEHRFTLEHWNQTLSQIFVENCVWVFIKQAVQYFSATDDANFS